MQHRQFTVYVGLCDSETGVQRFDTETYLSLLRKICRAYHVAFSVNVINGGYFHEDGRFVEETSLMLRLADIAEETVMEIAKDLCAFFRQESVMVTSAVGTVAFVSEKLFETEEPES